MIIRDFLAVAANGCVYETLGFAGVIIVYRCKSSSGAECFSQTLNPQCFIYDVELNPCVLSLLRDTI